MKTQIPLFRAKKIDSDEYIISMTISEGTIKRKRDLLFMEVGENKWCGIDSSTLSIHFPDIIDSEGTKIFASLSADGKGGDMVNIFGKGICYLTFDTDGTNATIIDNTANIFDDIFPFSESLAENDIGTIVGIKK